PPGAQSASQPGVGVAPDGALTLAYAVASTSGCDETDELWVDDLAPGAADVNTKLASTTVTGTENPATHVCGDFHGQHLSGAYAEVAAHGAATVVAPPVDAADYTAATTVHAFHRD